MRSLCTCLGLGLVLSLGCSAGQPGSDSLGTSVSASGGEESGDGDGDDPSTTEGDGDGDSTAGDGDGDPTTGDGDGDPTTGDGDGDPTTGDGDGDTGLTQDYRYAFSVQAGTWSKIPLATVWDDPNAPLMTDVVSATRLVHMPWLLLYGADGMFYMRQGGAWQAPEPIAQRFPLIADLDLAAMYHNSSTQSQDSESLTFLDNPNAVVYGIDDQGTVTHNVSVVMEDEPPPGAPQGSGRALWFFVDTEPNTFGQNDDWFVGWVAYNDGFLYRIAADFSWMKFPIEDNAFFGTDDEDEPDPFAMRAAWFEKGQGGDDYLYMVGP